MFWGLHFLGNDLHKCHIQKCACTVNQLQLSGGSSWEIYESRSFPSSGSLLRELLMHALVLHIAKYAPHA